MINPLRHMNSRRRLSLLIWGLNITLCLILVAFASR